MNPVDKKYQPVVAITGGIGSGKTEACRFFESFGARVFYADSIARQLINELPEIRTKIRTFFDPKVFQADGTLDRKKTAALIFQNPSLRIKLNEIVHPHVLDYLQRELKQHRDMNKDSLIIVEAALIFESGAQMMFDYIIVVHSTRNECIRRIMARDWVSRQDVINRMKAQLSPGLKKRRADFILQNSGDKRLLESNCKFLYNLLTMMNVHIQKHRK